VAVILDNLIEHAIVYSPRGGEVRVAVAGEGSGLVRVSDKGAGIDPAEAASVFDRFFRGSAGEATPGGTGLGHAIVRDLAARWGGTVELEPAETGTSIAVRFPPAPGAPDVADS
jgi:signal transduction histidine kinase